MVTVDFYYSVSSRYSYIVSTRLAALADECPCDIWWHPLDNEALQAHPGGSRPFDGASTATQCEWLYRERDPKRRVSSCEIPFWEPRGHVRVSSRTLALAATAAKRLGEVKPYSQSLFSALFVDTPAEVDLGECVRRAVRCGMSGRRFRQELDGDGPARELSVTLDRALAAGVFELPSFVVGGEVFRGNDQLVLLLSYLACLPANPGRPPVAPSSDR